MGYGYDNDVKPEGCIEKRMWRYSMEEESEQRSRVKLEGTKKGRVKMEGILEPGMKLLLLLAALSAVSYADVGEKGYHYRPPSNPYRPGVPSQSVPTSQNSQVSGTGHVTQVSHGTQQDVQGLHNVGGSHGVQGLHNVGGSHGVQGLHNVGGSHGVQGTHVAQEQHHEQEHHGGSFEGSIGLQDSQGVQGSHGFQGSHGSHGSGQQVTTQVTHPFPLPFPAGPLVIRPHPSNHFESHGSGFVGHPGGPNGVGGIAGLGGVSNVGGVSGTGSVSNVGGVASVGGASNVGGVSSVGGVSHVGSVNGIGGVSSTGGSSFVSELHDTQSDGNDDGSYLGGDLSAIPGEPGKDYPNYESFPQTSFSCDAQKFPGYYADVETSCQGFHVCNNGFTYNFLCPLGTIFHQEYFVCVWWHQFDCSTAESLYHLNEFLYVTPEKPQLVQQDTTSASGIGGSGGGGSVGGGGGLVGGGSVGSVGGGGGLVGGGSVGGGGGSVGGGSGGFGGRPGHQGRPPHGGRPGHRPFQTNHRPTHTGNQFGGGRPGNRPHQTGQGGRPGDRPNVGPQHDGGRPGNQFGVRPGRPVVSPGRPQIRPQGKPHGGRPHPQHDSPGLPVHQQNEVTQPNFTPSSDQFNHQQVQYPSSEGHLVGGSIQNQVHGTEHQQFAGQTSIEDSSLNRPTQADVPSQGYLPPF
ncbi:hypothetical protein J437_LFUL013924 [Ladona fulva]|uniref:Chitin-binding type-2 domain-containing protein n=1 Tax=Ladona fulva TaxID=123851 RepID=A0A8K0P518_LADFU|nr:hypothetical protein J437_LFUL013924 [Ladona fulva]